VPAGSRRSEPDRTHRGLPARGCQVPGPWPGRTTVDLVAFRRNHFLAATKPFLAGGAVTPKRLPVSLTETDQTREFDHVDGSQPDLPPVLLGPRDGDAQVSSLDGPLMRKA
jgi:hypothetical protein